MICTSVIPRLSNGLAKTDKVIVHVCPCFPASLLWYFYPDPLRPLTLLSLNVLS